MALLLNIQFNICKIMQIDRQTGLVLEGGGMRGVFTSGVLDCFMKHQLWFPYTIGVSAGACNGISYASRQIGRSHFSNIELFKHYDYIGLHHFLRGKGYIDLDYLFHVFPDKYFPFDFDTYSHSADRFVMVTSNCLTGRAEYHEEKSCPKRMVAICKASCTLPILCPVTFVDGVPMIDGGLCDSIPVKRAIEEGFQKNVVVLTRNKGYRKEEKSLHLPGFIYRQYPAIREQLKSRNRRYNETMDYIDRLEEEGKVLVIRPERPLEVGRTCRDTQKLQRLYNEGYEIAERLISSGIILE